MNAASQFSSAKRVALFLTTLGGIMWFGGLVVRAAVGFDMFVAGTLSFKPEMPMLAQIQTMRLFAQTSFYTLSAYTVFLLAGLGLWLSERTSWRGRGGLFIGGMLVLLYVPVELWQAWYDVQLIQLVQYATYNNFPLDAAKLLLIKRITILGGAGPFLSMLGYITAVFFLVVQPMRKASLP
jgi:hypothetical protein